MTDNFEPDPDVSPCIGCSGKLDALRCRRCKHRHTKSKPLMRYSK